MSDEIPQRRKPARGTATSLRELTLLVRIPGSPPRVCAFTAEERAEAESLAAEAGVCVEEIP